MRLDNSRTLKRAGQLEMAHGNRRSELETWKDSEDWLLECLML